MSTAPSFALPGLGIPSTAIATTTARDSGHLMEPLAEDKVDTEMENAYAEAERQRVHHSLSINVHSQRSVLRDVLNLSNVLTDSAAAIVDDSFNKCFTSMASDPWNWNAYLWPGWAVGTVLRHCILFPLRLISLILAHVVLLTMFFSIPLVTKGKPQLRLQYEQYVVQLICGAYMMSWNAVVKYHGPKPTPGPNKVWVSNHTSMIDYAILCSHSPFAVIMQLNSIWWVKFTQTRVLNALGCLWFNRTDLKDRHVVAARMKAHVSSSTSVPLLIFPEGTCVNNEYCVLFKRGAFDMGATVCPVAIKYNKIFSDAFWNSRRQSFGKHMVHIMTSWALVCNVWFLEPQTKREDETADQFAARVQKMIADTAGLKVVPWDGYLKYYNLGKAKPALGEKRRKVLADVLRTYLPPSPVRPFSDQMEVGHEGGGVKKDN